MVAVIFSQGSRRQIRQCRRYVPVAVVLALVARSPADMSNDSSDDSDGNRSGRPRALVATKTARFSLTYSGTPSAETNTIEFSSDVALL